MPSIAPIATEVQARCNALTSGSSISTVIDCAIAAKKVEMAGGSITRTVLDAQIQRVIDLSGGGSAIEDLIVLAAVEAPTQVVTDTTPVGRFVTGLGSWAGYLPCAGGTYLKAAYPALNAGMLSGLQQQVFTTSATTLAASVAGSSLDPVVGSTTIDNVRYVPAVGGMYMIGGSQSYNNSGSVDAYFRVRSSGAAPWALQFSSDNGATYVDHTDRLQSAVEQFAGGASGTTAVLNLTLTDVYVNGTNVVLTGTVSIASVSQVFVLASADSGLTFTNHVTWFPVGTGTGSPELAGIGNNIVMCSRTVGANAGPYYSTNGGATWVLSSSGAAYSSTKQIVEVLADTTRFQVLFSDGTSAYTAAANPAPANWTAVTAMPSVTSLSGGTVVGSKFIACGPSYVATSTTPGTWVQQTAAGSSISTLQAPVCASVGSLILFTTGMTAPVHYRGGFYCTDSGTLPATTAIATDDNVTCPLLLYRGFVYSGAFYIRMAGEAILRSTTLAATSWTVDACVLPGLTSVGQQDGVVTVKYGCMFFTRAGRRYVSYDNGITVRPAAAAIAFGSGSVVDAGTRLLALDAAHLLWQSTDGKTWNATGITRPTIPSTALNTTHTGRIEACGPYLYMVVSRNDSVTYVYVSSNQGSTWTTVSGMSGSSMYSGMQSYGLSTAARVFYYFANRVYVCYPRFSSVWFFQVGVSTDGVGFNESSVNLPAGRSYQRVYLAEQAGVLYAALPDGSSIFAAVRIPSSGAPTVVLQSTLVPEVVRTIASLAGVSYCDLSDPATQRWYVPDGNRVFMYSGPNLTRSSAYLPVTTGHSVFFYDVAGATFRTWQIPPSINAVVARTCYMPDSADSFTLPSISNTWVRAVA